MTSSHVGQSPAEAPAPTNASAFPSRSSSTSRSKTAKLPVMLVQSVKLSSGGHCSLAKGSIKFDFWKFQESFAKQRNYFLPDKDLMLPKI